MDKKEVRRQMLSMRRLVTPEEQQKASAIICARLWRRLGQYPSGVVLSYLAYGREVDLTLLHERLWQSGRQLAVPRTFGLVPGEMRASLYRKGDERIKVALGVYEPLGTPEVNPADIGVVLAPGVAFDVRLNRLGHGKGYYDRFLPKLSAGARVIGIAYKWQVLPELPVEQFDRPMDELVTD